MELTFADNRPPVSGRAPDVAPNGWPPGRTSVTLGVSDAVSVGAPDPRVQGWVPCCAALRGPRVDVVHLGRSGTLQHQALREQLPVAVAADPDKGAALVDLHGYWLALARQPDDVADDGVHPGARGYGRLAERCGAALPGQADAA